jgi:hypothetical protein
MEAMAGKGTGTDAPVGLTGEEDIFQVQSKMEIFTAYVKMRSFSVISISLSLCLKCLSKHLTGQCKGGWGRNYSAGGDTRRVKGWRNLLVD